MRRIKLFSVFVLVGLVLSLSASAVMAGETPPQDRSIVSSYVETQTNPNLTDEEKIKAAIDSYFKLRYESQKQLKPLDFSFLTADSSRTQKWARREKDKREIELYNAKLYKLNYVEYEYSLDYESIEVKDRRATVRLRESHTVVFEVIAPQVSKLSGLVHVITLRKTRAGWGIVADEYMDELAHLMQSSTKEQIIERIQLDRKAELQRAAEFKASGVELVDELTAIQSGGQHAYDRSAAVAYADRWWDDRNPEWGDFDPPNGGGDCTNYVSQVIYAGAPQMDDTGSYQWYYYGYNNRSPSWTDVTELKKYLKNNTWTGPYGAMAQPCSIQRGDVVQLKSDGTWIHSMAVVWSRYPNRCWDLSFIRANSHYDSGIYDYDKYHYPLSSLSGYSKRYIRILGWYD